MSRQPKTAKRAFSKDRIFRSVACSCAIETGESSNLIEARLMSGKRSFPQLTLAS